MKEHKLEVDIHVFSIGDKKIEMNVPTLGQIKSFTQKSKEVEDEENLNLMEEYFKELGVDEKDFNSLTLSHMTAMLKVVNQVPK